jgi:hypothetical protein
MNPRAEGLEADPARPRYIELERTNSRQKSMGREIGGEGDGGKKIK